MTIGTIMDYYQHIAIIRIYVMDNIAYSGSVNNIPKIFLNKRCRLLNVVMNGLEVSVRFRLEVFTPAEAQMIAQGMGLM